MRLVSTRTARARSAAALSALALGAMLALPGTAAAQDQNCSDFTYQEDAQAVYDQDRSDPDNLDSNGDGLACETLPRRDASTAATADPGSVDPGTGDATGARALAAAAVTDPVTATVTTTPDAAALVDAGTTTSTTTSTTTGTTDTTTSATSTAPCTTTVTATTSGTATGSTTATTSATTTPTTTTPTTETTTATTTPTTTVTTTTGDCSTSTGDDSSGGSGGGGSSSSDDRDCTDFSNQSDAQSALDADTKDPDNLDADDDGIACEDRFGNPDQQVQVVPSGGVDTGGDPVDG